MREVLHLPELPAGPDEPPDPAFIAAWSDGTACWPASWPIVLAMAVRDGATEVHYHPWRAESGGDALSYLTGGIRYGLVPPDAGSERPLFAAARRLAAPGPVARLWARVAGGAVGRVRLVAATGVSEWCVVCWGRGWLAGVEFLRLSPLPVAAAGAEADAPPLAGDGRSEAPPQANVSPTRERGSTGRGRCWWTATVGTTTPNVPLDRSTLARASG